MRITEAARRLGTSARMLRYRESLGLLPLLRRPAGRRARPSAHRQFTDRDLDAVALALAIERRYDISPAALAFGLKVITDPAARSQVAELGRRTGRIGGPVTRALDFEQERALRLLGLPPAARDGQARGGLTHPDRAAPPPQDGQARGGLTRPDRAAPPPRDRPGPPRPAGTGRAPGKSSSRSAPPP
jgi:MerR family transcriptional regulator, copper efflux regulator